MSRARFIPRGLNLDLPAQGVPPEQWTAARNMVARPHAERVQGYESAYGALSTNLRSLMNVRISGTNFWLYNGPATMYAVQPGPTHTDLSPGGLSSVTALNRWTVGTFNGLPIANNGVNAPMYWDGNLANNFAALTGWPVGASCLSLRAFRNFLFAINMSEAGGTYPDRVRWSSAAAAGSIPATWTAAATNEAGDVSLADSPGGLIDARPLGSGLVIYKARAAYLAEYVRGTQIFGFERLPIEVGVMGLNCIADFKGRHFLLTESDMVITDGASFESVANERVRRYLFNQLDQANYGACFVAANRRESEIMVCFPSAGGTNCDLALVWNWASNHWGVRELPNISCAGRGVVNDTAAAEDWNSDAGTWDSDGTPWNEQAYSELETLVMGAPNDAAPTSSLMYELDSGETANGSDIAATLGKYSMDLGDASLIKTVRRVVPFIDAPNSGGVVYVRVGSQMTAEGAITWAAEQAFTIGTSHDVATFAVGRFISIEFRSAGGSRWSVLGFEFEYNERGRY